MHCSYSAIVYILLHLIIMAESDDSRPQRPVVMPDAFSGESSETWEDWIDEFEECAILNKWSEEQMVQFMCVRLKGSARKALKGIDNDLK